MIESVHPILQALLGTLFTWGLTALGAGLVIFAPKRDKNRNKLMAASLGFAAGVVIAASFWSLLQPAITVAQKSPFWGINSVMSTLPVLFGFIVGAAFVFASDFATQRLNITTDAAVMLGMLPEKSKAESSPPSEYTAGVQEKSIAAVEAGADEEEKKMDPTDEPIVSTETEWRAVLLLIIVIVVHNIPEGLAVGVSFGAENEDHTFEQSRALSIAIGIQNIPEGLAVSLPLVCSGASIQKAFWYGQLSGMVEPVFGVLGAVLVQFLGPFLPWALSFAAGAMLQVAVSEVIPQSQFRGYKKTASAATTIGFLGMMLLEIGLT